MMVVMRPKNDFMIIPQHDSVRCEGGRLGLSGDSCDPRVPGRVQDGVVYCPVHLLIWLMLFGLADAFVQNVISLDQSGSDLADGTRHTSALRRFQSFQALQHLP